MGESGSSFRLPSGALSAAAIGVLLLVSLFVWTLPFRENELPFGEGDSAWHFAIGDNMASSDNAPFKLPYYVGVWYYGFNTILGPFALEYPPSSHLDYALVQIAGGERFIPVFLFRAFASFAGALAVFFLVSRLFGTLPAFIAGLGLSFSIREQMTYLFGQQPTLTSILITPITLYAWYNFVVSLYAPEGSTDGKPYLFVTVALLASQYLLHVQGAVGSLIIMAVFAAVMAIRFRRIPFQRSLLRPAIICIAFLAVIIVPFAAIYLGAGESAKASFDFGRLLEWGIKPEYVQGSFPAAFVQFSAEYPRILLPFLFLGLALLLLRTFTVKNNVKELFLLSWLVGVYLILHLDIVSGTGLNRLARMLVLENYVFFALIGLSVVWLPSTISSLLKQHGRFFATAKYALAALVIVALVFTSGRASEATLSQAYSGIERITPAQSEFAGTYLSQLPENAFVYDPSVRIVGQWRYPKMRWMMATGQRHVARYEGGQIIAADFIDANLTYFMFDYSDLALLASSQQFQQQALAWASQLQQVEMALFNNTAPLHDTGEIRLYKYQGEQG